MVIVHANNKIMYIRLINGNIPDGREYIVTYETYMDWYKKHFDYELIGETKEELDRYVLLKEIDWKMKEIQKKYC